ncbi:hypothetical protein EDD37DRAFT_610977 [Exophiala viscosa]|uniref:DUF7730 domain-containing protein n=1 Tax=Exophiala viscosa TaxID=2486360 RepID=A0AAN6IFT9_9EURO|nr:hypothetical protein EDD36DRAFT_417740 [Exophiala viscosa]KAI1622558.1 hypothetical protein EDD37DRAFT_610977 [Exophiala viscosa]
MSAPTWNRHLPYRNRRHKLRPVQHLNGQPTSTPPATPHTPVPQRADPESPFTTSATPSRRYVRPCKPFPFFQLPGEIRNKIYDLVVSETRIVISASHPQKELDQLKTQQPLKKHKRPRCRLSGKFVGDAAPRALMFTCRQMNQEAVEFIYARTTFCFDRFVVINKFLNVIPKAGARSIESLQITHTGYSEPQWMDNRVWKFRHDAKWKMTLERVKEEMTSLSRLKLDLTFFDWPCRLETSEKWARPLLHLAGDGLDWVDITLNHDRFHVVKNAATAKELENRMMTTEGKKNKIKEAKLQAILEKKRKEEAQRKATKVLTIKMPLTDKLKVSNVPLKKKGKGLEHYSWAQPSVAYC